MTLFPLTKEHVTVGKHCKTTDLYIYENFTCSHHLIIQGTLRLKISWFACTGYLTAESLCKTQKKETDRLAGGGAK